MYNSESLKPQVDLTQFLSSCRHRVNYTDKFGQPQSVACGHCPDCLAKRQHNYLTQCLQENEQSAFTLFVTLDYSEIYVPRVRLYPCWRPFEDSTPHPVILCVEDTKRPLKTKGKFKTFHDYGKVISVINTSIDDPTFKEFYAKAQPTKKNYFSLNKALSYPIMRYNRAEDIQNFIKRVRERFKRLFNSDVRYFAVSEYGPLSFRPHIHMQLYFTNAKLRRYAKEHISKCWKFGHCVVEYPREQGRVAKYVAGYLNSSSTLPAYLSSDAFKPRIFHSQRLGGKLFQAIKRHVYDDIYRAFGKISLPYYGSVLEIPPTSNLIRTLFPKCYNFERQNRDDLFKVYSIYTCIKELSHYGIYSVSDAVFFVLNHWQDHQPIRYFLRLLDIYEKPVKSITGSLVIEHQTHYSYVYFTKFKDFDTLTLKLYNRIYSAILCSRNFIKFIANDIRFETALNRLVKYHRKFKLFQLAQMYLQEQLYCKKYNPIFDEKDNTLRNQHFYHLFYYNYPHYQELYDDSELIHKINVDKDEIYSLRIKHKALNDQNDKFVGVL